MRKRTGPGRPSKQTRAAKRKQARPSQLNQLFSTGIDHSYHRIFLFSIGMDFVRIIHNCIFDNHNKHKDIPQKIKSVSLLLWILDCLINITVIRLMQIFLLDWVRIFKTFS